MISPKRLTVVSLFFAFSLTLAHGQSTPTVQQKSERSTCTNIVALTGNVNINCSSLTPEQKKLLERIPVLLNKILANQGDLNALMDKMDEMLQTTSRSTETVNAPYGVAIGGNNSGSATVNNYGPPDPHISVVSNSTGENGAYQCQVILKTDAELTSNIAFTLAFDETVEKFNVTTSAGGAIFTQKLETGISSPHSNNIVNFAITMMPPSIPTNGEIYVTITSKNPVHLLAWKRGW